MFRILKLENDEFAIVTEPEQLEFHGDEFEVASYLYSQLKVALADINSALDGLVYNNYRIAEFGINHTYTIAK